MNILPIINFKTAINNPTNTRPIRKNNQIAAQYDALPIISPIFYSSKLNISFNGRKRNHLKQIPLKYQVESLTPEQYPSPKLYETVQEAVSNNETTPLKDIHTKFYAPLLECNTLDEAKALYPEFENVRDAKDLSEDELSKTLKRIRDGKIEGITIENFSLELLKRIYGQILPVANKENYFNISNLTLRSIFTTLNIKALDNGYSLKFTYTDKKRNDAISKKASERQSSPDARKKCSDTAKTRWKENENFRKKHAIASAASALAWAYHSDYKREMKTIAKNEFPHLARILEKQKQGLPLTATDKKYQSAYFKRCKELFPDMKKQIAKEAEIILKQIKQENEEYYSPDGTLMI